MSVSDSSKPSKPGPPHKPNAFCRPWAMSSAPTADTQQQQAEVLGAPPVAAPGAIARHPVRSRWAPRAYGAE